MKCDNVFCIYWSIGRCSIDEISLDIRGSCRDCIYVDIEDEYLRKRRDNILKRYQCEEGESE